MFCCWGKLLGWTEAAGWGNLFHLAVLLNLLLDGGKDSVINRGVWGGFRHFCGVLSVLRCSWEGVVRDKEDIVCLA